MNTPNKHSVSILRLTAPDLPEFARNLRESKYELTINRLLYNNWPNASAQLAQCTKAVQGGWNDANTDTWKVVDNESKEIVGHLALTRKAPSNIGKVKGYEEELHPPVPDGMNEGVFRAVIQAVERLETLRDAKHFAMKRAEDAALPLSVCSEPGAHKFFLTLGFKDMKHAEIDLRNWAEENSGFGVFRLTGMVLDK